MQRCIKKILPFLIILAGAFCHAERFGSIEQVAQVLMQNKIITAQFRQAKFIARLNKSMESEGRCLVAHGKGIVWEITRPFPSTTIVGRDFLAHQTAEGEKVRMNLGENSPFAEVSRIMSALFGGDLSVLKEKFELSFAPVRGGWKITLLPADNSIRAAVSGIEISGGNFIEEFVMRDNAGGSTTYAFSGQKAQSALTAEQAAYFD